MTTQKQSTHIYGVAGFDLAYSQDKLVVQFFTQNGTAMCDKTHIALSTKLLFDVQLADVGLRSTQVLSDPWTFGYDKMAEQNGSLYLGIQLFQEKIVRSRIAAGLFEACVECGVMPSAGNLEVHWFFRTGVPIEYRGFREQVSSFVKEPIKTTQFNGHVSVTHIFENALCGEQPSFAAQSLFYTMKDGVMEYKPGFSKTMSVCAVDCGSQVCNFTLFGAPDLSVKERASAKVGTWSLISEHIRPFLCTEEGVDFADDYDVIKALRTRKIGHIELSDATISKMRAKIFAPNFQNLKAGVTRVAPNTRMLDTIVLYGGSEPDYIDAFRQEYGESVDVVAADDPVFVTAEGMSTVAEYHFRRHLTRDRG